MAWESQNQDGSSYGVFAQRFDAAGGRRGGEFRLNSYTTDRQEAPSVAADVQGNLVTVWQSFGQDGSLWGVFGQRYDASGVPLGEEFQVNSFTFGAQLAPDVASDAAGNFVVAWHGRRSTSARDIFAQRFDASGQPIGAEFQVNTYTTDYQEYPQVASDAEGNFVVVWESEGQDGSLDGVFGQAYDANGLPVGPEFQANTQTNRRQHLPAVSSDADGDFVVVWEKVDQSLFTAHIKAQRYAGPGLHLSISGSCPGMATATAVNGPPSSEVAIVAAQNTNGFVKGGALCPGTKLAIGEPFQLPPTFVILDEDGAGSAALSLATDRCWVQALALEDCQTSDTVEVQ